MKVVRRTVSLEPCNSRKSFYGKARVEEYSDGSETLISYNTRVLTRLADGTLVRHWDSWSATTGRHIRSFCGINKAEWLDMPVRDIYELERSSHE